MFSWRRMFAGGLMLVWAAPMLAAELKGGAPVGDFEYAPGTLAYAEIHHQLVDRAILVSYGEKVASAEGSVEQRRAAQIELLAFVRADPIGLFRQLRSERPVLHLTELDLYLVTRDRDVREVLHNPTVFSVRDYRDRMVPVVGPYMLNRDSDPYYNLEEKPWMRSLMLRSDLVRLRAIARAAAVESIRANTQPDGTLDLVPSLGRGVPVRVVQEYFGFRAPTEDMLRWSYRTQDSFFHNVGYVRGFRGMLIRQFGVGGPALQASQREARQVHESAFVAGEEMRVYLDAYIAGHSEEILAEDTVLARMLRLNSQLAHPKEMSRIRSNVMGGLIGAVETANAAIVQSVNQLLARPQVFAEAKQAAAALGDDEPIHTSPFANYVWEALRFHPINPFVVRHVEADAWIGPGDLAVKLRQGSRVLVATHSAMQDPRTVEHPDEFRVERPKHDREMNLGYGMHRCLGDYVAEVMVPEVVRQIVLLPNLQRVDPSPPIMINQGIDFGPRDSFPERYVVRHGS